MNRQLMAAGALAIGVLMAACGTSAEDPETSPSVEQLGPDRWMEDVYGESPETTLGQMILPGTHDSGSYGIDVTAPCDITPAAGASEAVRIVSEPNPCAAAAMYRAQDTTLREQLDAGIRYLDLRVSVPRGQADGTGAPPSDPTSVPFVLQHEYDSIPLVDGLTDILEYAEGHPKEQVILDFQHIDLPESADADYYHASLSELLRDFRASGSPTVCERSWGADVLDATPEGLATSVTLEQAWAADRNLIVLVPGDFAATDPCYYPRTDAIISLWPNTEDPATSITANAGYLQERQERLAASPQQCSNGDVDSDQGNNWCGFFVNQMQLTFQPVTYVGCIADTTEDCSLFAYSQKVNNSVATQIGEWAQEGLPVNIVIVDYFADASPSYTDTLIGLNRQQVAAQ